MGAQHLARNKPLDCMILKYCLKNKKNRSGLADFVTADKSADLIMFSKHHKNSITTDIVKVLAILWKTIKK